MKPTAGPQVPEGATFAVVPDGIALEVLPAAVEEAGNVMLPMEIMVAIVVEPTELIVSIPSPLID